MTKVEELNDISPGMGASNLALVLKDGKPRNGKINKGFEFLEILKDLPRR